MSTPSSSSADATWSSSLAVGASSSSSLFELLMVNVVGDSWMLDILRTGDGDSGWVWCAAVGHWKRHPSGPSLFSLSSGHKADNNVVLVVFGSGCCEIFCLEFELCVICLLATARLLYFPSRPLPEHLYTIISWSWGSQRRGFSRWGISRGIGGDSLFVVSRDNRRQLQLSLSLLLFGGFALWGPTTDPIGIRSFVFILRFKMWSPSSRTPPAACPHGYNFWPLPFGASLELWGNFLWLRSIIDIHIGKLN